MTQDNICELVRQMEQQYINGTTSISKYVEFDQYENINKIEAYLNSRHISGEEDSMGRPKPFFNIVTAAVNIWYRATDIDRKNIRIKPTSYDNKIQAYLATLLLQQWMRTNNFGVVLNEWGRSLARYGSSVLKFVEKDGELIASVVPWNRLICDTVDFDSNPKIEKLYLTPSQLKANKDYDQELVDELIEAQGTRKDLNSENIDNKADYIEIYEVHGEFPLSHLTGKESDEDTYTQQIHTVSFVATKDDLSNDTYKDFTLYSGKEKNPYMITHLIKEEGRTQSIGAVEHLFDAQWMVNHSVKAIKDQLDLASQLIFQTADGSFAGKNVLDSIITGDILITEMNKPLTQVDNNSHDITSLQNFTSQWQALAKEITSTPDIMSGNNLPAGTAYRQAAILQQESHSLFEIMTENKGLAIEDMCRQFIIPNLKKKMDSTEEIAMLLDAQGVTEFDSMYIPAEATRRSNDIVKTNALDVAQQLSNGASVNDLQTPQQPDLNAIKVQVKNELDSHGSQRFLKPSDIPSKTWKDLLKNLEWEVDVEVTNETRDKEAVMTTLTTVLQTIGGNPAILQDPNMKMLFNKILEETGAVSPLELKSAPQTPQMPLQSQNGSPQPPISGLTPTPNN